jgi:hypothetical protein
MKYLFTVFLGLHLLVYCSTELFSQNITYKYEWYKYYEPVEGKILGTLPHESRWNDIQKLKELKYRWGFNFILFSIGNGTNRLVIAKQIGYLPSKNIVMSIEPNFYLEAAQYEECWGYYLDEPADRQIPFNTVQSMKSWLKTNFPNAPFIISGYKRNSDLINYTNSLADQVLFSSYIHWWKFLGVWVSWPTNTDQRSDWTDMKNLFGNRFSMTWISAEEDMSEYNQLLGHANNLGLEGIWLYQSNIGTEVDENNFTKFCDAAVSYRYLTENYQQVRDSYIDGNFVSRQFVGPFYSLIPSSYDHSDRIFTDVTITNNRIDDYFAANRITAGSPFIFIVPELKKSSLNSSNEIILKPGFQAQRGCEFRAYITSEN